MKKLLMIAGAVAMISCAVPVYGTACSTTAVTVIGGAGATNIGTEFNGCTLTGTAGTVTFNGFTLTTGATGTLTATQTGNTLGFIFNPNGTGTGTNYSLSYTAASCPTCQVTGVNDVSTGIGNGTTYTYAFTGATGSGSVGDNTTYSHTVTGEIPATNTGNFTGGFNTLMTLDVTIAAATTATPEPTSLILFGSGFLAIGLVSRKRRKA